MIENKFSKAGYHKSAAIKKGGTSGFNWWKLINKKQKYELSEKTPASPRNENLSIFGIIKANNKIKFISKFTKLKLWE